MTNFEYQPNLVGPNAFIRAISESDFDGLYQCASNPLVWAGHPAKDRYRKDVFTDWFEAALSARALVIARRDDRRIMGSSRYYQVETAPTDISIGYTFLGIEYWGGRVNREIKELMIAHAFRSY
ncbi:MAG: GNAT family N-acetyltransferase, partial [Pseudomonadota bacterium]